MFGRQSRLPLHVAVGYQKASAQRCVHVAAHGIAVTVLSLDFRYLLKKRTDVTVALILNLSPLIVGHRERTRKVVWAELSCVHGY